MNSPDTGVPQNCEEDDFENSALHLLLSRRLEEVIKSREAATPEPQFSTEIVEEPLHLQCAKQRKRFNIREAEKHRMAICDRHYWRVECKHYHDALIKLMWEKARSARKVDFDDTGPHWRALATSFQRLLKCIGLSSARRRRVRQSIRDEKYWESEIEVLKQSDALREWEIKEGMRREMETRQATPPQSSQERPPEDNVASRTRSRLRSTNGARVTKRRLPSPRLGAKASRRR